MRQLRLATQRDLTTLVNVAISAFEDDEKFKPSNAIAGGPPGHNELKTHQEWLSTLTYLVCEEANSLAGTCILKIDGKEALIHGIHVHATQIDKGIGSWILNEVEKQFPQIKRYYLETPDYSKRNHHFYEKNGFKLIKEKSIIPDLGFGFFEYEKVLTGGTT